MRITFFANRFVLASRNPMRGDRPAALPVSRRFSASIAVFLAAFASRALWAHHFRHFTAQGVGGDWGELGDIAINLFHGRGFSSPFGMGSSPTAWECPLIPFIFASIMKMTGGANVQAARVILCLQCVIGAIGATLFWLVIRRLIDRNAGSFARWLSPAVAVTVCLWPGSLFSVTFLWDYVWQEAALALFLYLALLWWENANLTLSVLVGLTGAVLALINLTPGPIVLAAILPGILRPRVRPNARTLAVVAAFCFFAGIAPWLVRNMVVFHTYVPLRSNAGFEIFQGNNPIECIIAPANAPHPDNDPKQLRKYLDMGEIRYCRYSLRLAVQYIEAHPSQTVRRIADRAYVTWFTDLTGHWVPYPDVPWWKKKLPGVARLAASAALIVLSVTCFFWGSLRGRFALLPYRYMFAAVLILLPLPYYLTVADAPYTVTFRLCVAITSLCMMAITSERLTPPGAPPTPA